MAFLGLEFRIRIKWEYFTLLLRVLQGLLFPSLGTSSPLNIMVLEQKTYFFSERGSFLNKIFWINDHPKRVQGTVLQVQGSKPYKGVGTDGINILSFKVQTTGLLRHFIISNLSWTIPGTGGSHKIFISSIIRITNNPSPFQASGIPNWHSFISLFSIYLRPHAPQIITCLNWSNYPFGHCRELIAFKWYKLAGFVDNFCNSSYCRLLFIWVL